MTKLIRLTELTKKGDGTKTQPMLLNVDGIATVTTGDLKGDTPHIIGLTQIETVTFIEYKNGRGTFVQETLDEVEKLVAEKS